MQKGITQEDVERIIMKPVAERDVLDLETLRYASDKFPEAYQHWKETRDEIWRDKGKEILVVFPNKEKKTYKNLFQIKNELDISSPVVKRYIDTDKKIKLGKAKGFEFYKVSDK